MTTRLFPLAEYWWFYGAFACLIVLLLIIDLWVHRKPQPITIREAAVWTVIWIALGFGFTSIIYLLTANRYGPAVATQMSLEYIAGYLTEKSLSVDNMFVFALIFRYFSLESGQQHRVLFYGILGAMILRGVFVAAGSVLMQLHWVVIGFGVFLLLSGLRLGVAGERKVEPDRNLLIRVVQRFVPVCKEHHEDRFLVREAGTLCLTPLMVVLLVLESTDIIFAVDSVPAVFGVTKEPLIVYTSNVFAILGLRAMYFILSGALNLFPYLKYGLAVVLMFVGVKMAVLDDLAGDRLPIGLSLAVIATAVTVSVGLSLVIPRGLKIRAVGGSRGWDLARITVGCVCAALCCSCLVIVAGCRPPFLQRGLEPIGNGPLLLSCLCYAVCGWLLLRHARN